ncbi:MAG: DUF4123 domain-containing protein [Verrucomicrobia bacterium]|nr:DUF4123 domain-containing protein [Verrucomicrobiota bacterium]
MLMLHIEQLQLTDLDEFASLHWQLFERFRGHQVMAVLDGCGIPGLPELLDESGLIHTCLFDEPLLEELARAAPYAVVLEPYHPLTQRLLVSDWALTSGIFLLSTQSHQQLFKNLRVLFEQQAVDDQIRLVSVFRS